MTVKRTLFILLGFHTCMLALGQFGANDPTFNAIDSGYGQGDGADVTVRGVLEQPDQKILLWGDLATWNYRAGPRLVRLLADGNSDTTFATAGPNDDLYAVALQPDGRILAGGDFTYVSGTPKKRIMRLNTDGSLDQTFVSPGSGVNDRVSAIGLQSDGSVIIAGSFTQFNTTQRGRIARLSTAGALDASFNSGAGADSSIFALRVQPNGRILIAGAFQQFDGTSRPRIARLLQNGSLDVGFYPGTGANGPVRALHLLNDGRILIAGDFTMYDGVPRAHVARLNADGSLDASFDPGPGANDAAWAITAQSDGRVLVAGSFTTFAGSAARRVVRLDANGSLDASFAPLSGADSTIFGIAELADGHIIIGGDLLHYDGTIQKRAARLNEDGTLDLSFNPQTGADWDILTTLVLPDGRLIIGGAFTRYNGVPCNGIARLLPDGALDQTFQVGSAADLWVEALALANDGKIYVGGNFSTFNGYERLQLVRLWPDGSVDEGFVPPDSTHGNGVTSIIPLPGGQVLIGGPLWEVPGMPMFTSVWKLNEDGSVANDFMSETTAGAVTSLALRSDGKILVGRYSAPSLVRLNADGSLDNTFDPGTGPDSYVYGLAMQADDKAIVVGDFLSYNGQFTGCIVRVNSDGALDPTFETGGTGGVYSDGYSVMLQADGRVVVGGDFTSVGGQSRNGIVRLLSDGSVDPTFDPGAGCWRPDFSRVMALGMQPDGRIIAGGSFTGYDGVGRNRIARITNDLSTAVPEENAQGPSLFPNPSEGMVHMRVDDPGPHQLIVRDALGRTVLARSLNTPAGGCLDLDLSDQPAAVYFVTVRGAGGSRTMRLVRR